jgi:hypothetical protein
MDASQLGTVRKSTGGSSLRLAPTFSVPIVASSGALKICLIIAWVTLQLSSKAYSKWHFHWNTKQFLKIFGEAFVIFKQIFCLKGQLHEIFDHGFFFHQSTPPKALIHGLKPICIWPRIRRENRQYSIFSVVNDPVEIGFKKPLSWPVSIARETCNDLRNGYNSELLSFFGTNWRKYRRPQAMHTVPLSKQFNCSLSISAGSLTPLKRFQRGQW